MRLPGLVLPLVLALLCAGGAARADLAIGNAPATPTGCVSEAWDDEVDGSPRTVAGIEALTERFDAVAGARADDACRVALFYSYYAHYVTVQETLASRVRLAGRGSDEPRLIAQQIARVGWRLRSLRGSMDIVDSDDSLMRHVGRHLPDPWREYFTLQIAERSQPLSDGFRKLAIELADVRERLLRYESFLARNPTFPEADMIRSKCNEYLRALVDGTDNSPTFDLDDLFRPEVRAALEAYVADARAGHRDVVRAYLAFLKRHRFRDHRAADNWLLAHAQVGGGLGFDCLLNNLGDPKEPARCRRF